MFDSGLLGTERQNKSSLVSDLFQIHLQIVIGPYQPKAVGHDGFVQSH